MYFWQVISCNLFLNKNVKIAGKNCKIRKTFWCTVKVQWLTTSICWLSKGQWKYRGKWDAGKTCTFGSRNICSVVKILFPPISALFGDSLYYCYCFQVSLNWIVFSLVISYCLILKCWSECESLVPKWLCWHI